MTRHYYFPRPYPDELIGSLILRACHHRGLSLKTLSVLLVNSRRSYWPLAISGELGAIAAASGLDVHELLWAHTVFPYVTAFMSELDTNRLARNLIGSGTEGNAALTQVATQGSFGQRYCVECVKEDEIQFGEAYWHREHNLPFVVVCWKHNIPLQVLDDVLAHSANRRSGALHLPAKRAGRKISMPSLPAPWAEAIAKLNHELLTRRNRSTPTEWHQRYRALASNTGLMKKGAGLASRAFAKAFWDKYGRAFLKAAGLDFHADSRAWPALMLREKQGIPYATPKHVLLQVFLELTDVPNVDAAYRPPGRAPRDYAALDAEYVQRLSGAFRAIRRKNIRVETTQLLTELGIWNAYRHYRDKLPETKAALLAFRKTDWSARQLGKRPRKYK